MSTCFDNDEMECMYLYFQRQNDLLNRDIKSIQHVSCQKSRLKQAKDAYQDAQNATQRLDMEIEKVKTNIHSHRYDLCTPCADLKAHLVYLYNELVKLQATRNLGESQLSILIEKTQEDLATD